MPVGRALISVWLSSCPSPVHNRYHLHHRDVAQLGSAPRSGRGGRGFKSPHPDKPEITKDPPHGGSLRVLGGRNGSLDPTFLLVGLTLLTVGLRGLPLGLLLGLLFFVLGLLLLVLGLLLFLLLGLFGLHR